MKNTQYLIGSLCCVFLGAWATIGGVRLQLFELGTPASGLFPFLFGAVLTVIGLASLVVDILRFKKRETDEDAEFNHCGVRKVLAYFASSIGCVLLIQHLGFVIPCFTLLLVLQKFIEDVNWKMSLSIAAGFTLFCDVLFIRTLGVQLQSFSFL
ncbi:MAG: hypothetical protein ACI9DC_002239 [Gammaproteobacteria bacterium]|jgi:hypothetical protein